MSNPRESNKINSQIKSIVKFNQSHYKGERMEIPTTEEPPEATRELPEATKKLLKKPKGKLLLIINFKFSEILPEDILEEDSGKFKIFISTF